MKREGTQRILTIVMWAGTIALIGLGLWFVHIKSHLLRLWLPLFFGWNGLFCLMGAAAARGSSGAYRCIRGLFYILVAALYAGLWLLPVPMEILAPAGFFLLVALIIWMAAAQLREQERDREKEPQDK